MVNLSGKRVLVFGLGLLGGGEHVTRFCSESGATVLVTDKKTRYELAPTLERLSDLSGITYRLGGHRAEDFKKTDIVIHAPGIHPSSRYLVIARRSGAAVHTEASLFFLFARRPIIGVTGTRGKSSTAALIYHCIRAKFSDTVLAGNIHYTPMFSIIEKARRASKSPIVLELSSWHVESLSYVGMSPHTAVITNVFPDHLDYYSSLSAYYRSKLFIFKYQRANDMLIYNAGIPFLKSAAQRAKGMTIGFSEHDVGKEASHVYIRNGDFILKTRNKKEVHIGSLPTAYRSSGFFAENMLAAATAAHCWGISSATISRRLRTFRGLPGRQEYIRTLRGVSFYNDTNATTPEATVALLERLVSPVLIMGGFDKNLMYDALARVLIKKARGVIFLPGTATSKLKSALVRHHTASSLRTHDARSMHDAVVKAFSIARAGDDIALSPAAASFGLFMNAYDRGDQFIKEVRRLH